MSKKKRIFSPNATAEIIERMQSEHLREGDNAGAAITNSILDGAIASLVTELARIHNEETNPNRAVEQAKMEFARALEEGLSWGKKRSRLMADQIADSVQQVANARGR